MFDIGFWELGLIGVVALLVIGPERLPGVARTAGMWIGRIRGFVGSVQADINQELSKADQLKQLLEEQAKIKSAHEIIEETANEVRESLAVPAARPAHVLKAETPVAEAVPPQASRSVAASSPSSTTASSPTPTRASTPKEPAKADDVKHDQSA